MVGADERRDVGVEPGEELAEVAAVLGASSAGGHLGPRRAARTGRQLVVRRRVDGSVAHPPSSRSR
jgi:hypothetical protein